jgi:hypothetical protein
MPGGFLFQAGFGISLYSEYDNGARNPCSGNNQGGSAHHEFGMKSS